MPKYKVFGGLRKGCMADGTAGSPTKTSFQGRGLVKKLTNSPYWKYGSGSPSRLSRRLFHFDDTPQCARVGVVADCFGRSVSNFLCRKGLRTMQCTAANQADLAVRNWHVEDL